MGKQHRGQRLGSIPQAHAHVVVRTVNFVFVVDPDEEPPHKHTRQDRSDSPLQVSEIAVYCENHRRHTDKRDSADLRGDDRPAYRRPGQRTTSEKKIVNARLPPFHQVPDPGCQQEVATDYHPVDGREILVNFFFHDFAE